MKTPSTLVDGWQEGPNVRGTMDIIWSCVSTLSVSLWVMLHLNVPARGTSCWRICMRKTKWMLLGLLAPELVMLFACGQWASARRSTASMAKLGIENWSMIHAFYADSGGFMLRSPDCAEFPVTASQIQYLVMHKYLSPPDISREEIWDKSKADIFAKVVAGLQVTWFVAQIVARANQALPITLLELATLALITCSAATFFFWFSKPLDVGIPTVLEPKCSIAQILLEAEEAEGTPWRETPLDFVESLAYCSSQFPFHQYWGVREHPLPRLPNDRDPKLHDLRSVIYVAIPTAAFGTFHLIAWDFAFPSRVEQLVWRWVCLGGGAVLGIGCAVEAASIMWHNYATTGLTNLNGYKLRWPTNLLFLVPAFLYVSSRIIVIVEVVASLRALPEGCFATVQWTELLLHV